MKYILHYVGNMNRGGMENVIMNLYRTIGKSEFQFHFAVHGNEKGDYEDEIKSLGGEIIRFPYFRKNPLLYKKTWDEFWKKNYDFYSFFHYHTNSLANIVAIKQARKNGVQNIIIHSHSTYANKGKLQNIHNIIHKRNQKYVNKSEIICLAVTKEAGNWLFGENNNRVKIIDNGIDYEEFKPDKMLGLEIRKKLEIDEKSIVIGHVGNFMKVKNHEFLIDIFRVLHSLHDKSYLVLLGDGIMKEQILKKAEFYNLSENVIFLGNVSNVGNYLNCMDVFIFPSLYEGLGLSVVEAQVNHLPVLASETIPIAAKISEKFYTLSLNQDESTWAKKAIEIIDKDRFKKNIIIDNNFDISKTINELVEIYNNFD